MTTGNQAMVAGALRFKRVDPPAYVDRCYVADCYTIDRGRIRGWGLWVNICDSECWRSVCWPDAPTTHGWRLLGYYKTLAGAKIAAEQHRAKRSECQPT